MKDKKRGPPGQTWAYAYELEPPQDVERLAAIKALIEEEAAKARHKSETWEARLVRQSQVSHILIVSDSPDQEREVNRRIEAALVTLQAGFSLTMSLEVAAGAAELDPPAAAGPIEPESTPTPNE